MDERIVFSNDAWSEEVYIETQEFVVKGTVFMPKIGNRSRLLSDILNSKKQFIAIKNCSIESKLAPQKEVEYHSFIQLNMSTILIMRPLNE